MCEYEDFCFLLCAFLKNFCLVCSFRFHKTHSSLFISFINILPLKISLSFLPLFSKKLNSPPSRSVLAWPLFDQNGDTRDTNIWSAREYRHSHTQKHIYSINIMFAATQQIASIAGLKATKVQVRTLSSSSQYSFSGKDLVAFGARARVSLWIHFLRIQL